MEKAAGFDMVPRLTTTLVDRRNWDEFITQVQDHYKDDAQVELISNYILFKVGEYPRLPLEGHKFLRFSSRFPARTESTTSMESYINTVSGIAKLTFGGRICHWTKLGKLNGYYDWGVVWESLKSYKQSDQSEASTSNPTSSNTMKNDDSPNTMHKVMNIPGKGKGLTAAVNISPGARVLCEKPLLLYRSELPPDELQADLAKKLKSLSRDEQRQFCAFHNNFPGKNSFVGIVKTNAMPCGEISTIGAVYSTISRINHSCLPNCYSSWNRNLGQQTVHAIRPILTGQEITISYVHGGTSTDRKAELMEGFGFECGCGSCSLPESEQRLSDIHREHIDSLNSVVVDIFPIARDANHNLWRCRRLLELLDEEFEGYPGIWAAVANYDAFQICLSHGDLARASVFAERSYKVRVDCQGEDSPEAQRVKSFASHPENNGDVQIWSKMWKTKKRSVLKGVDPEQFEQWLWREYE
ncbi:hypothetical protein QQS21_002302 [Conoideocrella luteorostrata]|uniref:SET domain-containing protein n=1 Tax=Conoideocrella luteorostrata TaxID=1105319 RepID=A0AAJ0CYE4_9HYPO|nr:hypothetical protein QQS21_002302 [Conoideocrella luteorostrata]